MIEQRKQEDIAGKNLEHWNTEMFLVTSIISQETFPLHLF